MSLPLRARDEYGRGAFLKAERRLNSPLSYLTLGSDAWSFDYQVLAYRTLTGRWFSTYYLHMDPGSRRDNITTDSGDLRALPGSFPRVCVNWVLKLLPTAVQEI